MFERPFLRKPLGKDVPRAKIGNAARAMVNKEAWERSLEMRR